MSKKSTKDINKLRECWILNALLDCKKWSQQDIKKLWYLMKNANIIILKKDAENGNYSTINSETKAKEKLVKNHKNLLKRKNNKWIIPKEKKDEIQKLYEEYVITETLQEIDKNNPKKDFIAVTNGFKGSVSTILKKLKKSKIVKRSTIEKKHVPLHEREESPVFSLIKSYDNLYYILDVINNPNFSKKLKEKMLIDLINSEFANRLINDELIELIQSKLYLLSLTKEDKKLILFCLENFPTALYKVLRKIYDDPHWEKIINSDERGFLDQEKYKNSFIMDIKNWAYEDIRKGIGGYNIDFEMSMTIEGAFTHLNKFEVGNVENEKELKTDNIRHHADSFAVYKGFKGVKHGKQSVEWTLEEIKNLWQPQVVEQVASHIYEISYNLDTEEFNSILYQRLIEENGKEIFINIHGEEIDGNKWLNPPEDDDAPY